MDQLAAQIARYALSVSHERLSPRTIRALKHVLLDAVGCAVGAFEEQTVSSVAKVAETCGTGPGRIWSTGGFAPLDWASFANSVAIRSLDLNDTFLAREPAHPSDNIGVLLTVAASRRSSGAAFLSALAVAYDVHCAFCDALSLRPRGWDHTTFGAFSSVPGLGRLIELPMNRLVNALGMAGVVSPALIQTRVGDLSEWKGCAFAHAARNGLQAVLLAEAGLRGPSAVFEGEGGFFRQISGGPLRLESLHDGQARRVHDVHLKRYVGDYHAQSAIEACEEIVGEHGDYFKPGEIDSVLIETVDESARTNGDLSKWKPTNRETADHSLPFLVAKTLVSGPATLTDLVSECWKRSDVRSVIERTSIVVREELNALYPSRGIPNRVVVRTVGGREYVQRADKPLGHAQRPMSEDDVRTKFLGLAEPVVGPERADSIMRSVDRVHEEDGPSRLVVELCGGKI